MDGFVTVFVVSPHVDDAEVVGAIVGLVATIICILLKTGRIPRPRWLGGSPGVGIVGGCVLFIASVLLIASEFVQSSRLTSLYHSGQYEVAEGMVHVLHAQAFHGHDKADVITVGSRRFEVDAFVATPGYDLTISHGGALREGVHARVCHHDGVILRIDVRRRLPAD